MKPAAIKLAGLALSLSGLGFRPRTSIAHRGRRRAARGNP